MRKENWIFTGLFVGYVAYGGLKMTYNVSMHQIADYFTMSKAELGMINSLFSFAYGTSKFMGGIMSDFLSPSKMFAFSLFASTLFTIAFGLSNSFYFLCLTWFFNGLVQGMGWPALSEILLSWFFGDERVKVWGLMTTASNIGSTVVPLGITAIILYFKNWRLAFIIPSIISMITCIFVYQILEDSPQEKYRTTSKKKFKISDLKKAFVTLLSDPKAWTILLAEILVMLVMKAILDWGAIFLMETQHGYELIHASNCILWFNCGTIFSAMTSGFSSSIVGGSKMNCFLHSLLLTFILTFPLLVPSIFYNNSSISTIIFSFFYLGCGVSTGLCKCLLGIIIREDWQHIRGLAGGILGFVGQIGSMISGYPIGLILQMNKDNPVKGWSMVLSLLWLLSGIASIIFGIIILRKKNKSE